MYVSVCGVSVCVNVCLCESVCECVWVCVCECVGLCVGGGVSLCVGVVCEYVCVSSDILQGTCELSTADDLQDIEGH